MARTDTQYPTRKADLAAFAKVERLHERGTSLRKAAQTRIGYRDFDLARLLGCDTADVAALQQGVFDRLVTPEGSIVARTELDLPAKALALLDLYKRFLTAAEVLPPRAVPEPEHEAISALTVGDVDATKVAWLKSGVNGFHQTGSRYSTLIQNAQLLQQYRMSVATFAAALGLDAKTVFEYLAGMKPVPVTEDTVRYWNALSWLATVA